MSLPSMSTMYFPHTFSAVHSSHTLSVIRHTGLPVYAALKVWEYLYTTITNK